jgi:magnesium-transporting ATPase (P-type)
MAFVGLGFFTVYNAYCSRSLDESIFKIDPRGNKTLILGIACSIISILAVVYIPFMQAIFHTRPLTGESWAMVLGVGLLVVLAAEVMKRLMPGLR